MKNSSTPTIKISARYYSVTDYTTGILVFDTNIASVYWGTSSDKMTVFLMMGVGVAVLALAIAFIAVYGKRR